MAKAGIAQPGWSATGRWSDAPPPPANRGGPPDLRQAEAEAPPHIMCPCLYIASHSSLKRLVGLGLTSSHIIGPPNHVDYWT